MDKNSNMLGEESEQESINSDELRKEIERKYKQARQSPAMSHDSRLSNNSSNMKPVDIVRTSSQMSQTKQTRMSDS